MSMASQSATLSTPARPWMIWTGRVLSAILVLFLVMGAAFGFTHPQQAAEGMKKFGYADDKLHIVLAIEVGAALLYIFPPTAVLGAVLLTGYLGGAVATHVRIGDPGYPVAVLTGILVWAGLYLRDERVRALLPLRRPR